MADDLTETMSDIDDLSVFECRAVNQMEECCKEAAFRISKNFKLLAYNIRSIYKNFDEFLISRQRMAINFDVVVLTSAGSGQTTTLDYRCLGTRFTAVPSILIGRGCGSFLQTRAWTSYYRT